MAGDIYSRANVPVGAGTGPTFGTGNINRLDLTVHGGAVLLQFEHGDGWSPPEGMQVGGDLFQSITGLDAIYPPGPIGVRFQRADPTVPATVDFVAYSTP